MSSNTKKYEGLLSELADHVGLDASALRQSAELIVDGITVGMTLKDDEEADQQGFDKPMIYMFCALGEIPKDRDADIYRELLRANAFGAGAAGASFSLQPLSDQVILAQKISLSAHANALARTIKQLVSQARNWQKRLEISM